MKTILTTLFLTLISCIFYGCEPIEDENHHRRIMFCNCSENDVYVEWSENYPDTSVYADTKMLLSHPEIYKVKAHTQNRDAISFHYPGNTFEKFFNDYRTGVDSILIFVFDAKKMEAEEYNHVRETLLHRYYLTLDDLRKANWTLYYPPQTVNKED